MICLHIHSIWIRTLGPTETKNGFKRSPNYLGMRIAYRMKPFPKEHFLVILGRDQESSRSLEESEFLIREPT